MCYNTALMVHIDQEPTTSLGSLLYSIPGFQERLTHSEPIAPRPAQHADPAEPLPPVLAAALHARGITQLYAHQAAALDAARSGAHVGIVTATASGKTLCYQLAVLETLLEDPANRALFLFPTKALAQDQLRSLNELLGALDDERRMTNDEGSQPSSIVHRRSSMIAATLDGDTPRSQRAAVRARTQIILSNPDMLHRSVLPDHGRWAAWLARLRFVVLDEAHVYRGVFGTHVALIMRRLQRLCAHYGSAPQFICCSATSANPEEHLHALVGAPVTVINEDGAPQGRRQFVFWNPPTIEPGTRNQEPRSRSGGSRFSVPGSEGRRRSTNIEAAQVLASLVRAGVKTLCFTRTRRGAELVLRYTREALENMKDEGRSMKSPNGQQVLPSSFLPLTSRVAAYRAGYAPEDRRRLEQAFMSGEILGLVSTNALELGVDIGGVDAVVISGFPGSIASTWQQAGRAGRSQGESLAVLVAQDDPLDQFYMRHPEQFFTRPHEHARVALSNPYILRDQLLCAAGELPLHDADETWFGPTYIALRDHLLRRGDMLELHDGRVTSASHRPAADVNIRTADGASVALRDADSGRTIEQLSASRAPFEIYPGAVYLHQGDSYVVNTLNRTHADARRAQVNYYTQPREETDIEIERVQQQRTVGPATLHLGVVQVTRFITGYRRKEHYSEAVLSEHDLSLPPQTFRTIAVWWTVPEDVCRRVEQACGDVQDALHAMEHAAIGLLPFFAQCDRADIGGLSIALHPETGAATIFVYDGVPGGVGIAQVGYEQAEEWWAQTRALLMDCPCADGCPACIQSPKCGNGNQHLSKAGALALASLLLGHAIPPADLRALRAEPTSAASAESMLADMRSRLQRARATPPGPRRAALLIALRYRLATERATAADDATRAALAAMAEEAAGL
jgi:DEAD/DEAH box helicase domain-containing protein